MKSESMITHGPSTATGDQNSEDLEKTPKVQNACKDFIRGSCNRENCRFSHSIPPKPGLKELFRFCHDFQNKGCFRTACKFIHATIDEEEHFFKTGVYPQNAMAPSTSDQNYTHHPDITNGPYSFQRSAPSLFSRPPPPIRDEDSPPEAKFRRFAYIDEESQCLSTLANCANCKGLEHKIKILYDNISVLLKKVTDLSEKNNQLTTMNEFLLEQTAGVRTEQPCVITSGHGPSAPVSLATVSMTPVVSLSGALPTLMPAAPPNLALAPAASRGQLLTPAPQILTVSTTQQLMGNSGALIVTSAGAQQLMQVSDSGTLMGGGQTVVAVTPAQLTIGPPAPQLISSTSQAAVQQLVQQSAQHQAQYAAQQSVHLAAAQQSAQHLAAAQQSAQQLAAQQSQQLAAQQSQQQLVHQTSTQQITISSTTQPMGMTNSQAQPMSFPILSQNILPH